MVQVLKTISRPLLIARVRNLTQAGLGENVNLMIHTLGSDIRNGWVQVLK